MPERVISFITSPAQGAQQECSRILVSPPGATSTGRSGSCDVVSVLISSLVSGAFIRPFGRFLQAAPAYVDFVARDRF